MLKEQGSSNLVTEHGAHRACPKVQVHQTVKGSNPNAIHSFIHRAVMVPLQQIHKQQKTEERIRKNHSDVTSLPPFLGFGGPGSHIIQTKTHYNQRSFQGICTFHNYLNETGNTRSVLMGHVFGDQILVVWDLIGYP